LARSNPEVRTFVENHVRGAARRPVLDTGAVRTLSEQFFEELK